MLCMMKLTFSRHALERMFERGIRVDDVRAVVESGEVVQTHPDRQPTASRVMLGFIAARALHVVCVDGGEPNEVIIITTYWPEPSQWSPDFKRRID